MSQNAHANAVTAIVNQFPAWIACRRMAGTDHGRRRRRVGNVLQQLGSPLETAVREIGAPCPWSSSI
ncbi:MAG: hypothetical protein ACREB3_08265, partial [Burkholderiales bacterium]